MAVLSLLGMGPHSKKMCHTFKLFKGGVSMSLPPNQKEQESQQIQPKQTQSPSKQ